MRPFARGIQRKARAPHTNGFGRGGQSHWCEVSLGEGLCKALQAMVLFVILYDLNNFREFVYSLV
jgi:hypothetical protein